MEIFVEKFGGASVNSADAIRNVEHILSLEKKKRVVIISAMGKTTNKLENIVNKWFNNQVFFTEQFEELKDFHLQLIEELFDNVDIGNTEKIDLQQSVKNIFEELKQKIKVLPNFDYNFLYDSIVSYGEILSTTIISSYLNAKKLNNRLLYAHTIIKTDNNYRDANINFSDTNREVNEQIMSLLKNFDLIITQGFLGGTKENLITTLGREGSDYSAAILAYCLNAKSMTVWKDVAGLLNADPKRVEQTIKIHTMPYTEAVELSYYGASIIHPKTIKPLENVKIPLYIKSFKSPTEQGTVICESESVNPIVPNFIFKDNQLLLSIMPKDLSFVTEISISTIFSLLAKHKVKVNMIQNSAISFSICFDDNRNILPALLNDLEKDFLVRYNEGLQLVTIRHYTVEAVNNIIKGRRILIEQKNRMTAQYLIDNGIEKLNK